MKPFTCLGSCDVYPMWRRRRVVAQEAWRIEDAKLREKANTGYDGEVGPDNH